MRRGQKDFFFLPYTVLCSEYGVCVCVCVCILNVYTFYMHVPSLEKSQEFQK